MKYLLIMVLLTFIVFQVSSEEFYVKLGYVNSQSDLKVSTIQGFSTINSIAEKPRTGYSLGMGVEMPVSFFDLIVEVSYIQKGFVREIDYTNLNFTYYTYDTSNNPIPHPEDFGPVLMTYHYDYDYIELPVLAKYSVTDFFSVYAGLSFNFFLQAELSVDNVPTGYDRLCYEHTGEPCSSQDLSGYTDKTDYTFISGVRLSYSKFLLDARYIKGLSGIAQEDFVVNDYKIDSYSISIGYYFD